MEKFTAFLNALISVPNNIANTGANVNVWRIDIGIR